MKILVINSGSSSIKYQLFEMTRPLVLAAGLIERIGEPQGVHKHTDFDKQGNERQTVRQHPISTHRDGLVRIGKALRASGAIQALSELSAIGHRVVHGGEYFRQPTLIDDEVVERIREMIPLAPLHNPANLLGIEITLQVAPDTPHVAVFDTAFHQSIPEHAWRYALPAKLYSEHHVRRYGFHGTSHHYVAKQAALLLGRPLSSLNLITLHLGNGASAAAIRKGSSVDTSMGMTPLEGLIMGTRCGDIDPAIHFYLGREAGLDNEAMENLLNKESGLKGICGSNDMREVQRLAGAGDHRAEIALDMYSYRIKKYIGAYTAALGHVDAVVFTGGIGENDSGLRARVCTGLTALGIAIDSEKNHCEGGKAFTIHNDKSTVSLLVIPTDEELEIAQQSVECLRELA